MSNNNMYSPDMKVGVQTTFFGKVMGFFALAIIASAAGTYLTMEYALSYIMANQGIMWGLFILELILVFTAKSWSTKVPLNRVLFFAFAFISGATAAPLVYLALQSAGPALLTKALMATGLTFGAAALFGTKTGYDMSGWGKFLMFGLVGMIILGIIHLFVPWSSNFELGFSGFGILLFSAFAAYDFQQIKHYPEDRYIDAALNLYLDFFNLFIMILRFMLAFSSRD